MMTDTTTLPADVARCPGRYEPALDGFGKPSPQCTGCLRRVAGYPPGRWYFTEVPVFDDVCPQRIETTA